MNFVFNTIFFNFSFQLFISRLTVGNFTEMIAKSKLEIFL